MSKRPSSLLCTVFLCPNYHCGYTCKRKHHLYNHILNRHDCFTATIPLLRKHASKLQHLNNQQLLHQMIVDDGNHIDFNNFPNDNDVDNDHKIAVANTFNTNSNNNNNDMDNASLPSVASANSNGKQ